MRSHDTVSKFAYVSIFTDVSKCLHVNGALGPVHMHTFTYVSKVTYVSNFTYGVM